MPALARIGVSRCLRAWLDVRLFMWAATTDLGLASVSEVIDTEGGLYNLPYGRRTIRRCRHARR